MHVVATAGHVDHGKSTLVRALTGMEPDRWAEERRRGMTIDLGYAWTSLPSGETLAFVDVPGHQRFLGNMLAGLGPAPAVLVVVAADEGWRRQSSEHLAAVDALELRHGLLAVTRSDLADPGPATEEALSHLEDSSLGRVPAVAVSGVTGLGLKQLRTALDRLVAGLPAPDLAAPVRLWVDRAFTIRGTGTVVTGTLAAGRLRVGDELELDGRRISVRGLQSLGAAVEEVGAVARVAVNLRGVELEAVGRGSALLAPDAWTRTPQLDVRLSVRADQLPAELTLHIGTVSAPVRVRPLGGRLARLGLPHALPIRAGDRALLRDPSRHAVAAGVLVLDADPPALRRRGAAASRAAALEAGRPDFAAEVVRRGVVRRSELAALGVPATPSEDVRDIGEWHVATGTLMRWQDELNRAVARFHEQHPLEPGVPDDAAVAQLGLPDRALLGELAAAAGVERVAGRLRRPGFRPTLGAWESSVIAVEKRLRSSAFDAPDVPELEALALGPRELAAAETAGRLLRIGPGIVLLPDGPARAMRVLAALEQPFTTSAARQALGVSRRVAVPLLEHLDGRGWTERVDASCRRVRAAPPSSAPPS